MSANETPSIPLATDEQKVSYGFGMQFGQQLRRNLFEGLDIDAVIAGIRCVLAGKMPEVSEEQLNAAYAGVQRKIQDAAEIKAKKMRELGISFLEQNRKREGVQTTASGLQYEILEEGTGAKPGPDSTVRVHYHGTHIDGSVFDSSVQRNEPAEFGVTQVIRGWTEILQLMPVGSKWRVTIPSELAYGEMGSPPVIPGHSVLVFEIHLIDIL